MSYQEIRQEDVEWTFSFKPYQSSLERTEIFTYLLHGLLNDFSSLDHIVG
jgi:hypothetical protein